MIDLHLTGALLFLIPGLAAYCAIFQVFGSVHLGFTGRRTVLPIPAEANSVRSITLILLWSLAVHALTGTAIAASHVIGNAWPLISIPRWLVDDPYAVAVRGAGKVSTGALAQVMLGALAQGYVSVLLVQNWLTRRMRDNTLPRWLYGWAAELANLLDDEDKVVVLWVMTTKDTGKGTLTYSGILSDISIKQDGSIGSVSLETCERYVVDLDVGRFVTDLTPTAKFGRLIIEGSQIRNLVVEVVEAGVRNLSAADIKQILAEARKTEQPSAPAARSTPRGR